MKTSIQKAIEDIKGYRTFSEDISIRFVVAMLKGVYIELEKNQIMDAYNNGYREAEADAIAISIRNRPIAEYSNAEDYYNELTEQIQVPNPNQ